MKKIRSLLLVLICLFSTAAIADLKPAEFRDKFIRALDVEANQFDIEIIGALEFKVTTADGNEFTSYLDNAYALYLQDPDEIESVLEQYVSGLMESALESEEALSIERVIPIIKDTAWGQEMIALMKEQGAEKLPEYYQETLADGLAIYYAEDRPSSISYLTLQDLEATEVELSTLRSIAITNLKSMLPEIEIYGGAGLFMIVAGGNFEASLLLVDDIWQAENFAIDGDIVIAIPARDMLLVSGTENKDQLKKLIEMTEESYAESSYYLTKQLYVRKHGKWAIYSS